MKKLFSLLLVVAMIASMSIVSFAADTNVMKAVLDETAEGIAVTVTVTNPSELFASVVSFSVPKNLTWDTTYTLGSDFAAMTKITPTFNTSKADYNRVRMNMSCAATEDAITASGEKTLFTLVLTRDAGNEATYTSADFAFINASGYYTNISPVTGTKLESTKNADNFIAPVYTDSRAGGEEKEYEDAVSGASKSITFAGKIKAFEAVENYGVEVNGKKFFGAMVGDMVSSDGTEANFGNTEVAFSDSTTWDGSFQINLTGIKADTTSGSYKYFVNGAYVTDAKTVAIAD